MDRRPLHDLAPPGDRSEDRDAGITRGELARRLGRDEKEARRILDPKHRTKLPTLAAALAALDRRLVIGVEAA